MDEMRDVGPDRGPVGCSAQGGHGRPRLGRGRGVCHLTPEHSLCTHSPSVQFLESSSAPLQSRPPFWGGGAMHSRLRQCAHSVLQADHLLHSVHAPSTVGAQHMLFNVCKQQHRHSNNSAGMHAHMHARNLCADQQIDTMSTQPQAGAVRCAQGTSTKILKATSTQKA